MADLCPIWDRLSQLFDEFHHDPANITNKITDTLAGISNSQLLTLCRFPGNAIVTSEMIKQLASRYNGSVVTDLNPYIWQNLLQICMEHPENVVYRRGIFAVTTILSAHFRELLFEGSGGLKADVISAIDHYADDQYLPKLMIFLHELLLDIAIGWINHCSHGKAAKTELRVNSRDFLLPKVFQIFQIIAPKVKMMQIPLNSLQSEFLHHYMQCFENLVIFDKLCGQKEFTLPRCFESDVHLAIDILYDVIKVADCDVNMTLQILYIIKAFAGHRIFQTVFHPPSPANIEFVNYHLTRIPEVLQIVNCNNADAMMDILKELIGNLPNEVDMNSIIQMVFLVSEILFSSQRKLTNDDALSTLIVIRDTWRRLRNRLTNEEQRNYFIPFHLKLCSTVEAFSMPPKAEFFYDSEACQILCETMASIVVDYNIAIDYFIKRMTEFISFDEYYTGQSKISWNLCLFAATIDSLNNTYPNPIKTLFGENIPVIEGNLQECLQKPDTNDILTRTCRFVFVFIDILLKRQNRLAYPIVASTILLFHRIYDFVEKSRNYEGILNITRTSKVFFDHGFNYLVQLSFHFHMIGGIRNRLYELTKYGTNAKLAQGSLSQFEQIIQGCLVETLTPPEITAEFIHCYLASSDGDGSPIYHMLTPFVNQLRFFYTEKYDEVSTEAVINLFAAVLKVMDRSDYGHQLASSLVQVMKEVLLAYQNSGIVFKSCVQLFHDLLIPFFDYVKEMPLIATNLMNSLLDTFETIVSIGNNQWLIAEQGDGDYTTLINLLNASTSLIDRQSLYAFDDAFGKWFEVVVRRFLTIIINLLTEPRMLSLEVSKAAFTFFQSAAEYNTVLNDLDVETASTYKKLIIFGMNYDQSEDCAVLTLSVLDKISSKMAQKWEPFFYSITNRLMKIIIHFDSDDDIFESACNVFYHMRQANAVAYANFFKTAPSNGSIQAYQESLHELMEPLKGVGERGQRLDHFHRLEKFKDDNIGFFNEKTG